MPYTDLTDSFSPNLKIVFTDFDALAENDAFKRIPIGTRMFFFQASAPVNWSLVITGAANRALRVVSGAGGGSGGGADFLGSVIDLAHIHTTPGHTHQWADHAHDSTFRATVGLPPSNGPRVNSENFDGGELFADAGGDTARSFFDGTFKVQAGLFSGLTAPALDSKLGNITFKFFDAMVAEKQV